jgi:pseudomonalisin/xanthomonalisin
MVLMAPAVRAADDWVATQTRAFPVAGRALPAWGEELLPAAPVRVAVSLRLRNKAQLDALAAAQRRGGGAALDREQSLRRFAPTPAQAEAVADYLRRSGFIDVRIAANRLLVSASGSAATVKTAFHTRLRRYNVDGRETYANADDAMVPAALGDTVLAVLGLQTVRAARPMYRLPAKTLAHRLDVTGHSPVEFAALYGAAQTPDAAKTTVGIISAGDLTQTLSDLDLFTDKNGLARVPVSVVQSGSGSSDTSGTLEWNLDSQDIVGAGGGRVQAMLFYNATSLYDQDLEEAFNQAVSDDRAAVVNVSLGECEDDAVTSGAMASEDQIFELAQAQGQTFSVSSGDSGSNECGGATPTHQSYPAVSPFVMAIGGTTLSTSPDGRYTGEEAWSGGGGGNSGHESRPDWQFGVAMMGSYRALPDVAFDADPASGAVIVYQGGDTQVGGTSLSAPIFTGIWARLQSAQGNQLGFPGKWIYDAAQGRKPVYRDVVAGSNGAYSAGKGWDFTTGWGSMLIDAFDNYLAATRQGS